MKERVDPSDARREPGQLKTGGARCFEHGSGAPQMKHLVCGVSRVKGQGPGFYLFPGEQGWYRASRAPRSEGRFLYQAMEVVNYV